MSRLADSVQRMLPRRVWLWTVGGVLALVLLAIGYVQSQQYKLLSSASQYQNDALGWSFSQLETEQLRLLYQLQRYVHDSTARDAEQVQLRYDIFVSRIGLVDHPRAANFMRDDTSYLPALARVRAFVKSADQHLNRPGAPLMSVQVARELITDLEALNKPLHELSLGASHLLYQRVTDRNHAVRRQAGMSIGLTAFQCLLLLVLAFIVLRQLRALTERKLTLETLAETLSAARQGAEAASRAKSAFLANMSHEIRTPFHGLLGMLSLLDGADLSPQQASHIDTARESAQHLLTILNGILDISQLESGKLQVMPQTVDLPQLIAQVDALMRVQALGKGLNLQIDLAADMPRWVQADPTRVKQILFNLLSNAVKFTPAGVVQLSVSKRPAHLNISSQPEKSGKTATNWLDFKVTDSGIGMDTPTLSRLFQRFMQGDESPSRSAGGAGLGLEISRNLARLMGGDITVSSQLGTGSSFTASLPLPSLDAPALESEHVHTRLLGPSKRLRILVAEDHPVNRAYMEAVLEKLGHSAVFKVDGHGAVMAMQAQTPKAAFDLVLMDLHMPGMDGFSAARAIRAMPAPQGQVPIIALTADAFQESRDLASAAGMNSFLTKPAHLPQLREALEPFCYPSTGADAPHPTLGLRQNLVGKDSVTTTDNPAVLVDTQVVTELQHNLSAAQYTSLLRTYFADKKTVLTELHLAAAANNLHKLAQRAHALKGASLSLGLAHTGQLADQLQTIAKQTEAQPDLGTLSPQVQQLVQRIEQALNHSLTECVHLGLLPAQEAAPN
jgi:two-component system, sensor histidine kinase